MKKVKNGLFSPKWSTKNGPGYNKNSKKFESAILDIHDGMHQTWELEKNRVSSSSRVSKT